MTIKPSIWGSAECDAWSRGFDYDNYLMHHHKRQEQGKIFSEEGYRLVCAVFEHEMLHGMRAEGFQG